MAALATVLSRPPPPDPDIHATLSDFLGLTEALPSTVARTLTLIEHLRHRSEQKISSVHQGLTAWSIRPAAKDAVADPIQLRRNISYALEETERASRMALEEAIRLDETCKRESRRLGTVLAHLKAQPLPPSRDPTPEQQALTSPNLKRDRRMSTRDDDPRPEKVPRILDDRAAVKLRGRKIMVPGEVLPPPDPNAPPESISDWSSARPSPIPEDAEAANNKQTPRPRSRTPKVPKGDKDKDKDKDKKPPKPRAPRQPGQPGTNAHSSVAGISTSNALLALTAPPDDAPPGSKWLPWMKLTEWEMAKLRKRMKKNAIWVPSQTMVRRELKALGRGVAGKEAAKTAAQAGGEDPFVDEHDEPDPTRVFVTGEESAQMNAILGPQIYADDEDADAELINRGMRLNEAKKLKRQKMLEEQQALEAQIAREQGLEPPAETKTDTKKRKREPTPSVNAAVSTHDAEPASKSAPAPKKLKISGPSAQNTTSKVPLAPAGPSGSPKSGADRARRAATPPVGRKPPTLVLKANRAVSDEPQNRRASLRRGSNASLPSSSNLPSPTRATANGATRRSRRPAPGFVTSGDDDSAKVGVSKRKAAPKKKGTNKAATNAGAATALDEAITGDSFSEDIDPDEPRYCLCGDVSWGTMIGCDNEESCENQWFHLSCVKLDELPPRRTKWYCPDCRKKLKLGQTTNGLVGRAQGR